MNKEHPNLVAQQELDAAESKDGTTEAAIAGAKAEVQREQTLLAYTRITAPFDGVITERSMRSMAAMPPHGNAASNTTFGTSIITRCGLILRLF